MPASKKHEDEAERELAGHQLVREWIQTRISRIHERVTLYDVLRKNGVTLDYEDRASQFSCPFHGKDTNPSARAYPADGAGPSHAWCFVCQERWDAISIWKKFNGSEKKFTRVLTEIEIAFGLTRPEFPDELKALGEDQAAEAAEENFEVFHQLERACENRLVTGKKAFTMKAYASAVSLLERVGTRVLDRRMSHQEGEGRLRSLLDNISKRRRDCPVE